MDIDDDFLYGSDQDDASTNINITDNKIKDETIDTANGSDNIKDSNNNNDSEGGNSDNDKEDEDDEDGDDDDNDDDDDSEDSSDDDIEFVIGDLDTSSKATEHSLEKNGTSSSSTTAENSGDAQNTVAAYISSASSNGALDLDKIGEYNGIPITRLSFDELKDKPWRLPGANISDYFNYV
ncbi:unnamed protein product [[Candida] boidinii]|nr:unnamed protein product [[Candida] boidinii]